MLSLATGRRGCRRFFVIKFNLRPQPKFVTVGEPDGMPAIVPVKAVAPCTRPSTVVPRPRVLGAAASISFSLGLLLGASLLGRFCATLAIFLCSCRQVAASALAPQDEQVSGRSVYTAIKAEEPANTCKSTLCSSNALHSSFVGPPNTVCCNHEAALVDQHPFMGSITYGTPSDVAAQCADSPSQVLCKTCMYALG